jgi:hypothetical protein
VTTPVKRDFGRRKAILPAVFLVVGIGVAVGMTMMGLDRDHYFFYDEPPSSWSPAFGLLALFLALTVLETAALAWLMLHFSGRTLWKGAILGLIVFMPWTIIHTFAVMHAPGFILMHAAWLMVVCIALAVLLVANLIARLIDP